MANHEIGLLDKDGHCMNLHYKGGLIGSGGAVQTRVRTSRCRDLPLFREESPAGHGAMVEGIAWALLGALKIDGAS